MAAAGLFNVAKGRGETYEIGMDEVLFTPFEGTKRCTGTEELNSCTVVTLVSSLGAILAHIPPRPKLTSSDPEAGDHHTEEKMDEFGRLFHRYRDSFPPGKTTWVVSAIFQGEIALPHQKAIIERKLGEFGLTYTNSAYMVIMDQVRPPKGTVFIDARGEKPLVYVEDHCLSV